MMINHTVSQSIRNRRSIFPNQFNGKKIPDQLVKELLINAHTAPSHRLTQPWLFKVYSDSAKMNLAKYIVTNPAIIMPDIKKEKIKTKFELSSHIICVCMRRDTKLRVPEWEEIAATSMAVQNIWLSCSDSQIGGYWSTPSYVTNIAAYLNLEENERCLGFFYLGMVDTLEARSTTRNKLYDHVEWFN